MNDKKLYKSKNKMLVGVCGGIGEYIGLDATLVRLLFVLLGFWGPGLIAYIAAAIIVPEQPEW